MTMVHLQALLLVFSLCLFTISARPTTASEDENPVENTTQESSTTTEPLATTVSNTDVTTMTVVMTTQPSDESKPEEDNNDKKINIEKEDLLKPLDVKPKKPPSPQYLLYEVEKGIRELTMKEIVYILDIGKDENVISIALADKLGYLPDGDSSDPHIKVIEANQEQLVSELKHKSEEFKKFYKHTTPPPPPVTTTAEDKGKVIEYKIIKRMDHLSVEEIDKLLDYDGNSILFALGDALHFELGLEYLAEQSPDRWRDILLKARERRVKDEKEHPATAPPQDVGGHEEHNSISENDHDSNSPPFEEDDHRSPDVVDERPGDYESRFFDHNIAGGVPPEEDNNDLTDTEDSEGDQTNGGKEKTGEENVEPGGNKGTPEKSAEPGGNKGHSEKSAEPGGNEGHSEKSAEPGGNEKIPNSSAGSTKTGGGGGQGVESKNGLESNSNTQDGDKELGGSSLEAGDGSEDLEETRSSFGAWHFLTIFILIGVAVVVGYVCVHNRKKLREGVGTYISDANKRRRRAREYKPLINT